jgi:hypothetical protein
MDNPPVSFLHYLDSYQPLFAFVFFDQPSYTQLRPSNHPFESNTP